MLLQAIFFTVFALVAGVYYYRSSNEEKLSKDQIPPPMFCEGFPILGNFIGFGKDPLGYINKGREKLGGIFTIDMLLEKVTFLIGPDFHKPFFEALDDELDQAEVYNFMTPVFGKGVVYDAPLQKRRQQMRALGAALKPSNLKSYSEVIEKEARDYFKKEWGKEGEKDLLSSMAELIILTASATLLGPEVRNHLFLKVSHLYKLLDKGLTPLSVFFPNAPLKVHKERDYAREEMVKLFSKVIEERKKTGVKHNDMLQRLLEFKYGDGTHLSNQEITGMLIAALFAGQHTSSISTSWTALFVMNDEERKERMLKDSVFMKHCIKEAIRLYPPLILLMRRVKKGFNCGDFYVPKGHRVMVSNALAHRLEECFEKPNDFIPERWENEKEVKKYGFLGFGAGIHSCMGEAFAFIQIETILRVMFSTYDLQLTTPFPEPDYEAIVVPPKGKNIVKYKLKENGGEKLGKVELKSFTLKINNSGEEKDLETFSLEEVKKHNSKESAWLVVEGYVYDVTEYVELHPGGSKTILHYAGKADATKAVLGPQHPKTIQDLVARFRIGKLE